MPLCQMSWIVSSLILREKNQKSAVHTAPGSCDHTEHISLLMEIILDSRPTWLSMKLNCLLLGKVGKSQTKDVLVLKAIFGSTAEMHLTVTKWQWAVLIFKDIRVTFSCNLFQRRQSLTLKKGKWKNMWPICQGSDERQVCRSQWCQMLVPKDSIPQSYILMTFGLSGQHSLNGCYSLGSGGMFSSTVSQLSSLTMICPLSFIAVWILNVPSGNFKELCWERSNLVWALLKL